MKVTYRQLTTTDKPLFADAISILNRTQGRDLFAQNYLDSKTNNPLCYVVAAFAGEELAGIGVTEIISNFDYYLPFDSKICDDIRNKKVGSFSTMAILESLQGKGIGQGISQLRMSWVKEQRCDIVLGVSWVSGLSHTSNRVFEKMGFRAIKKVERFYEKSSLEKPFICPGCGEPPCSCAAILYRLDFYAP